jgi:hypothetical protein
VPHPKHLDHHLRDWPYQFGEVLARKVRGSDRRQVLQLRIDLGIMQLETTGRPDGQQPEGFDTYYDYLVSASFAEGEDFELDVERCQEIDREFVQFYYRRIAWLALRDFDRAVADSDHTLTLMDFSSAHAPDDEWAMMHEQYRPFVLFHRTQAAALAELDESEPEKAVAVIDEGLEVIREIFREHDAEDAFDDDELVTKLRSMRDALEAHYGLEPSLADQLAEAIAAEEYERAAELRDRIEGRKGPSA